MKQMVFKWIIAVLMLGLMSGCNELDLCEKEVKRQCGGCSPKAERYRVIFDSLDESMKKDFKKCINVTADIDYKNTEYADAGLNGCVNASTILNDEVRDKLFEAMDQYDVPQKEYEAWFICYSKLMGVPAKSEMQKPTVLLMDSHLKDVVYCDRSKEIGASNADDIINLIKDLPINVGTVSTNLEWMDYQRVIDMKPNLIVVHASAFYRETKAIKGNTRLLDFLDSLKGTGIKVIVYTRGVGKHSEPDAQKRFDNIVRKLDDPELAKNAKLYQLDKVQDPCFRNPDVGSRFVKEIKEILALN